MKFKHYNSATSFVPWKKDYPTSHKEKKKKDCPISPHNFPATPHLQDACDLKGVHVFSQHLIWNQPHIEHEIELMGLIY